MNLVTHSYRGLVTGLPHCTLEVSLPHLLADNQYFFQPPTFQDDWYEGFFIPKGTICLANIWCDFKFTSLYLKKFGYLSRSMNRDPAIYVGSSVISVGNCLIFTLC